MEEELEELLDEGDVLTFAENVIYITGAISTKTVAPVISAILSANIQQDYENIFLFINSNGGDLLEAFALIDCINASKIPVITIALGDCASSALMIAMTGKYRYIMPKTNVLSHQYSAGLGVSKHVDIKARYKDFRAMANKVIRHYLSCTGLSEKKIKKHLVKGEDVFLTSKQCIKYNLFDEILENFDQLFDYGEN